MNPVLLPMVIWFYQHHLLNSLSFLWWFAVLPSSYTNSCICVGLYQNIFTYSIHLYVHLWTIPHCCNYCSFMMCFNIWWGSPFHLLPHRAYIFLYFHKFLVYSPPPFPNINLRIILSSLKGKQLIFFIEIVLNCK